MAEHSAVNRRVVGSSPTRGATTLGEVFHEPSVKPARPLSEVSHELSGAGGAIESELFGSVVKRLRHRPFTAVTRVRFPSESLFGPLAQLVRATGS